MLPPAFPLLWPPLTRAHPSKVLPLGLLPLLLLLLFFLPLPALGNLAYPDCDALSRVVAERNPLGFESLFLYDLNGNLVWKRDPKGQETALTYDALNRLTRVDYADGQWAAFSFDENGNRTEIEGSDGQRVAQTFDELDRVRTITHSALDRQLSYEYTATGARSAFETRDLTNGFVERTSYEWDASGRPVAIRPPTGDVVAYRYAPDGAREGATLPNGVDVGYQYDSLGRLVEMSYRDPSSREIAFFRYTYSTAGSRTSQVDTEGLTQYTYGALDRLVEARYPDGSFEKFSFDQVGNRLSHEDSDGITAYAYDQGDRLLATTGVKPSSFAWDDNGNMLSKTDPEGTVAYRWNARDRLVRVDLPDGASNLYRYLPESDLRLSVTDKTGAETRFLWDGSNVVEELGPTNGRLASYIEGLGVDEHLARVGADGVVHAYLADPLGTVRALVDASGQIQNAYAYKAFGDVRAAVEGLTQPYRFTGRAFEPDTGEYYYRARYYQPGVGRFGAVDRYAPGEETYGYAAGNPGRYIDPSGNGPELLPLGPAIVLYFGLASTIDRTVKFFSGPVVARRDLPSGTYRESYELSRYTPIAFPNKVTYRVHDDVVPQAQ